MPNCIFTGVCRSNCRFISVISDMHLACDNSKNQGFARKTAVGKLLQPSLRSTTLVLVFDLCWLSCNGRFRRSVALIASQGCDNLTNIFQRGWTHQQYIISLRVSGCFFFLGWVNIPGDRFLESLTGDVFVNGLDTMRCSMLHQWCVISLKLHVDAACYATHGGGWGKQSAGMLLVVVGVFSRAQTVL